MNELHLLSILLLAVSSSLDNLGTGVSYGLRNICIPLSLNLLIAVSNSSGTLLSMLLGKVVSGALRPNIAGLFGALLLIAIGSWIFLSGFGRKLSSTASVLKSTEISTEISPGKTTARGTSFFSMLSAVLNDPLAAGILCSSKVKTKEGAILAAALTLSNLSTGTGAGLIGFDPAITTAAVFLCSVLAVSLGINIGHYSSAVMIKGIAEKASGLLLIFIGLYELAG